MASYGEIFEKCGNDKEKLEKFLLTNTISHEGLHNMLSTSASKIEVQKMIISDYFQKNKGDNSYFDFVIRALQHNKEIGMYIIQNFDPWGSYYNDVYYVDALLHCHGETGAIFYSEFKALFPNADYGKIIRELMAREETKLLKLILSDNPQYREPAFRILFDQYTRSSVTIWKLVTAFHSPASIDISSLLPNKNVKAFVKKFNENPQGMIAQLMKEF